MARQNHGPLSRAKGKLGGVVYQQYEGMQISREYQPVVKNPQTTKQTENRAKFKLSSQIVAEFKEVLMVRLSLLSSYTRMRRAQALNAIYGVISTATPDTPSALVDNVVSAINAKSVSAIAAPSLVSQDGTFKLTADNGKIVTYVHVAYNTNGALIYKTSETFTSTGTAKDIAPIAGAESQLIMAVTAEATTEAGRAIISNLQNTNGDEFNNTIDRAVASGDLMVSNLSSIYE